MSNKCLSELQPLSNLKSGDLFYVVDTATNILEGKKITAENLLTFFTKGSQISSSWASSSLSASYINPSLIGLINSASYALSSSRSERSFWALFSDTSSYIDAGDIFGKVDSSSYSDSSSYLIYNGTRPNGTASFSLLSNTASYAKSASYVIYVPGIPNGTVYNSITSSYVLTASLAKSASYLIYNGSTPNGTASYSNYSSSSLSSSYVNSSSYSLSSSYSKRSSTCDVSDYSNFLSYYGTPNGTASYSITSSRALQSNSSSYLEYDGITPNGTSSYSLYSEDSLSASYALSASRSENSFQSTSSSYALTSSYPLMDPNQYKIYGPYNTADLIYGTQTSTELSYRNFVIHPEGNNTTIIVQALCDVKVPITTTDTDSYTLELIIEDWTGGSLIDSFTVDTSRPNNFIDLSITGAFTLSGYSRVPTTLMGANTSIEIISGSWYTLRVKASNGASFDGNSLLRGAQFFIYTKPDTSVTRTAYPPF